MKRLQLLLWISLLCLPACSEPEPKTGSELKAAAEPAPMKTAELVVGPGKEAPSFCQLDANGSVSCFGLPNPGPRYSAMRAAGPYRQLDLNCGVTTQDSIVCWAKPLDVADVTFPLGVHVLGARQLASDHWLCGIGKQAGSELAYCLQGNQTYRLPSPDERKFLGVATSGNRACFLHADQSVSCTDLGTKENKKLATPHPVKQIAMNSWSNCALYDNSSIQCFKEGNPENLPFGVRASGVTALHGNAQWICARYQDGDFQCWDRTSVISRQNFGALDQKVALSGTSRHGICAQWQSGGVSCLDPNTKKLATYEEPKMNYIFAGQNQSCAASVDGKSYCWGRASDQNLQQDTFYFSGKELALGKDHSCLASSDGVSCKGDGSRKQLDVPAQLRGAYVSIIDSYEDLTCAIDPNSHVTCWGGAGDKGQWQVPAALTRASDLAVGQQHACATASSGKVFCWGDNSMGQASVPASLGSVKALTAGAMHTCALKTDGTASCWGNNSFGQSLAPANVAFQDISAGSNDTCGVDTQGRVSCWGEGRFGQRVVPEDLGPVLKVAVADRHVCAVKADEVDAGRVRCWGEAEGADQMARVESSSDPLRLRYDNDLYRLVTQERELLSCSGASCRLRDEPFLAFKGLNFLPNLEERYQIYLKFTNTCRTSGVALQIELNGSAQLFNPYSGDEFRIGLKGPQDISSMDLSGSTILRLRANGSPTAVLPAGCSIKLRKFAIVPDRDTLEKWKGSADEMAQNLPVDLKQWAFNKRALFLIGNNLEMSRSKLNQKYNRISETLETMFLNVEDNGFAIPALPFDADAALKLLFRFRSIQAINASGQTVGIDVQFPQDSSVYPWFSELRFAPFNQELNERYAELADDYAFILTTIQKPAAFEFADLEEDSRYKLERGLKRAQELLSMTALLRGLIADYFQDTGSAEAQNKLNDMDRVSSSAPQLKKVADDYTKHLTKFEIKGEAP